LLEEGLGMEHGTVLYETSVNFFETIAAYQIDACGHNE